ncbi:hypothetical protein C9I98_02955 [Photobacterium sanctipauli]|uniref:Uncharacterized protein n=1 Tax=Photobacterium sanctipauli TaxID=1342794 RepID=A0A2T3P194_9GAMM|nr:hypothetical protein [Photobacterium sanctipauli]PSW22238.1 hypothetical protein C9I98_02955 [Photobacterium sanctipauli]
MTNYQHYESTVDQVYRSILQEVSRPWHIQHQPALAGADQAQQAVALVSPRGTVCQRITLPSQSAQHLWPDNSSVSQLVTEYVVRGAARLAPLRQSAFRNNFPHWLERCLQQLHFLIDSKDKLLSVMKDPLFPFPSNVKVGGTYLPCWVWYQEEDKMTVSVIDRRTGQFAEPRNVAPTQLVDRERWLGAQVIDSVEESIDTIQHYVNELIEGQKQREFDEPKLMDAITNPCASTLSPVMSVALTMVVVAGFFITFKWLLGF